MKICWDNLEKLKYSKNSGKWYKWKTTAYEYFEECPVCGDSYLGIKKSNFCSNSCARTGNKFSEDRKKKIGMKNKGNTPWNKGISCSLETKLKISEKLKGENHPNWKGGISNETSILRRSLKYRLWRENVYERDEYTCQRCEKKNIRLNAHHIEMFSLNKKERFNVDNGITLCEKCHKIIHSLTYERKRYIR